MNGTGLACAAYNLHSCDSPVTTAASVATDPCRGYEQKKITENVECEIMQVIVNEAAESYKYALNSCLSSCESGSTCVLQYFMPHLVPKCTLQGNIC